MTNQTASLVGLGRVEQYPDNKDEKACEEMFRTDDTARGCYKTLSSRLGPMDIINE